MPIGPGDRLVRGAVELTRDLWSWPEVVEAILTPTVYERWITAADERVCPECGPLDGLVWEAGSGPAPPLHVNCRCARAYAFTTRHRRP
jgi:hypothetical protein